MSTRNPDVRSLRSVPRDAWTLLPGAWAMVAPFALGFAASPDALWNSVLVGAAIALSAAARAVRGPSVPVLGCIWNQVALGAWLLAAPFVLGYAATTAALWNDLGVGLVTLALIWRSLRPRPAREA